MKYLVIEIQKTDDQISHIITTHDSRSEAESKYYLVLSAAAVSSVPKHACSLLTEDGVCIRNEAYEHRVETAE